MTDLLTTRQVQEILKVDRITIYRMLQDGRLKGVKVGSQWRFPQQEVERILEGRAPQRYLGTNPNPLFPTHCVQTIQNLLSGISEMCALVLDASGEPVTEFTAQPGLSRLILNTSTGHEAYRTAWHAFAMEAQDQVSEFTCPLGLSAAAAPIHEHDTLVGWFLVGQVYLDAESRQQAEAQSAAFAARFGVSTKELAENVSAIRVLSPEQWDLLKGWALKAAQAIDSILHERTGYKQRLQQIADLTQMW
ncbi:MAG: helix-turn-helix domain-containing protein [Bellilinea sp.]